MSVSHLPVRPPSIKAREELTENGSARTKVSKSIRILQMSLLDLQIVYVHGSASELGREILINDSLNAIRVVGVGKGKKTW